MAHCSIRTRLFIAAVSIWALLSLSCSNNPYPEADDEEKVLYLPFATPPKTLDPAVSYGTADNVVTNKVFDTLLEYHYFERPYRLLPSMARELPEAETLPDGKVRYTFHLRPHLRFEADECFGLSLGQKGKDEGRPVTAHDFVFELKRIADPALASPVTEPFSYLAGFKEFSAALAKKRAADKKFGARRIDEQYREAGAFPGAMARDDQTLVITLNSAYPQILYWFAMPFTTPVAWEAAAFYNGREGRSPISEHAVSTGSYVVTMYDKQARIVLARNPTWWGLKNLDAPGATFPEVPADAQWDDLRPAVGKPLPFVDRIEYRMEKEAIPQFNKFIQGYYDFSGINRESFDKVIHEGGLSKEMEELGMTLEKGVEPGVYYLGFNMDDPVVGRAGGERARALRQAMSLSVDVTEYLRLFSNGRGLPAHSPIPPGLFGYEESYKNPYREPDLERAAQILKQAGLPGGIDPKTGRPVRLTFDVGDTSPAARVRFMFWVNQWRKLGLDVQLAATNYNQFYEKMKKGSYQIYQWGWMADYPDPENFMFLLITKMARSESGGPNSSNFKDKEFDRLFEQMATRDNDDERQSIIVKMRTILERERPWIELFHPESFSLSHGWVTNVRPTGLSTITASKYYDVDPQTRKTSRKEWNKPVLWPAFAMLFLFLAVLTPGVLTYYRERT